MKHFFCAKHGDVLIRPLHRYDIEFLRQLRNQDALNHFFRNVGYISEKQQEQWFKSYIQDKDMLFFSIDLGCRKTVGSVALYGFHGNVCQIGKLVVDSGARGHNLGRESFLMAMCIGMEKLGVNEFRLSVHEDNVAAKKIYEKIGFVKDGSHPFERGGEEAEMVISVREMAERNPELVEIYIFDENGA